MSAGTVVGIDIGTTAVKALLLTRDGVTLARYAEGYPSDRPSTGRVEQDPDIWMRHVLAALARFESSFDLGGLQAIGICSQVNTHVFVGRDGQAIVPAIVWQDVRCAGVAAELDASVDAQSRSAWWGAPLPIDASHCLSRMEWMRRNRPALWEQTERVMSPKDFCISRLTGAVAADAIASIGLVDGDLRYIQALLDRVPGAATRLAPLCAFTQVAGSVGSGLPCAGTPVVVGTMDAWAGMFGVGVGDPGTAMYLSGTSDVLGIVSPRRVPTPGVAAFPTYDGITLHAAPTQSGGASLAWLSRLLGRSIGDLSAMAASVHPDERVPLFAPHIDGERAPVWDPYARGVFVGLDSSTDPARLARSVMEGVAYSVSWALEALEQSADLPATVLDCGGGGFGTDVWNQIRADALGRTLRVSPGADVAARGAAAIALSGVGACRSIADGAIGLLQDRRVFHPDPARRAYHDQRLSLYKDTYAATREISRRHVDHAG